MEQSTNGGKTFHEVNNWNTIEPDSAYTHADLVVAKCLKGVFILEQTDTYAEVGMVDEPGIDLMMERGSGSFTELV